MFKELNESINAIQGKDQRGTKPLDKLFDDMDNLKDKFFKDMDKALPKEVTYTSRLESEVKQLKHIIKGYRFENATLKEENFQLKEELETAEDKVALQKKQLFKLGQAIDTLTGNKKGESDHE